MNASGVNQYLSPARSAATDVPVYLDADETAATGRISQQVPVVAFFI